MPNRLIKDPVRYKTVLCEKFLANGECPYGHKCQFAHGTEQLRERVDKKTEKKTKRGRPSSDELEAACCQPCSAPAAPAIVAAVPPPRPQLVATVPPPRPPQLQLPPAVRPPRPPQLQLPPGLGLAEPTRKVVTWAPAAMLASELSPASQPTTPPRTPPRLAENEPPQTASREPPLDAACEPLLRRVDSGTQPELGINSVTGKVELVRVGRQASHNTATVRRQLSLLFADDPDDIGAAPTSGAIWQRDPFGLPPVGAL